MTTETHEASTTTTAPTTATTEPNEDAALLEGFASITGEQPPADSTSTTQAPERSAADAFADELEGEAGTGATDPAAGVTDTTTTSETTQAAAQAALDSLTDDQLKALEKRLGLESLKQGLDKAFGKVGELNRFLQGLKTIQANAPADSTAAAAARKFERAMLKELDESYPNLADAMEPVFARLYEATAGQAAAPSDEVKAIQAQNERLLAEIQRIEMREVNRAHPGWQRDISEIGADGNVVTDEQGRPKPSAAFVAWFATKDQQYRDRFWNGMDGEFVAAGLTDFKTHRQQAASSPAPAPAPAPTPAPAPAAAAPSPAAPRAASKTARLAAAAPAQGMPATVGATREPTEEDDLMAGFAAVHGSRL